MVLLILFRNRRQIRNSMLLSVLYLFPVICMFPSFFYGRPQLISFFLLYATLYCLYRYRENENDRCIYFVPLISALWSNVHAGSSPLSYLLCFLFLISGLFDFSAGKVKGEKLSRRQLRTYLIIGLLSVAATAVNPNGPEALLYPFANMGDSFMQAYIAEWSAPDVKQVSQLVYSFLPLLVVGVSFIMTEKNVKALDLLLFLLFAYLFFRSVRFGILFLIASTFYCFDYLLPREVKPMKTKWDRAFFCLILLFFIGVRTVRAGKEIPVALDSSVVDLIKEESPKRLFNDYNYGETLIYNGIDTFVDAREDLFAKYNLQDAFSLLLLQQVGTNGTAGVFDPEAVIDKYGFDAFVIQSDRPLAVYLKSRPDKYLPLLEDGGAVYFKVISGT